MEGNVPISQKPDPWQLRQVHRSALPLHLFTARPTRVIESKGSVIGYVRDGETREDALLRIARDRN